MKVSFKNPAADYVIEGIPVKQQANLQAEAHVTSETREHIDLCLKAMEGLRGDGVPVAGITIDGDSSMVVLKGQGKDRHLTGTKLTVMPESLSWSFSVDGQKMETEEVEFRELVRMKQKAMQRMKRERSFSL